MLTQANSHSGKNAKPYVAITMGDPVGIGPEIIIKSLLHEEIYKYANPIVVGDLIPFKKVIEKCKKPIKINVLKGEEEIKNADYRRDLLNLIQIDGPDLSDIRFGIMLPEAAEAAYKSIEKSVELALKGPVHAIATAPINKAEMRLKYPDFIGHTELLENLTGSKYTLTAFKLGNLMVFFLTRHIALREVFKFIKKERILITLKHMKAYLEALGLNNPRIAVAALNPHAGEEGIFGSEEIEEIGPAVEEARRSGINVEGPIPADVIFWLGRQGKYDAILSLYHDQGHIATKTVDFYRTISITLGLPFIRTSPDHGTAYPIAGKCKASEESMAESIKIAGQYAVKWKKSWEKLKSLNS